VSTSSTDTPAAQILYRHPLPVRIWHFLTAFAVLGLLFTGLNVLNVHPRLYWGEVGNEGTAPFLALDPKPVSDEAGSTATPATADPPPAVLTLGSHRFDVTGWMGAPLDLGNDGKYFLVVATPDTWHFGGMRSWHFAFAWILGTGWLLYGAWLLWSGRLRLVLWPARDQLTAHAIGTDLKHHLSFRRARGAEARRYNLLQKVSYLIVLGLIVPALILTGMTMSNAVTSRFPELYALFGGRQSARTLHAFLAIAMLLFVLIHVIQVFVAGVLNEIRSMITGWFVVRPEVRS